MRCFQPRSYSHASPRTSITVDVIRRPPNIRILPRRASYVRAVVMRGSGVEVSQRGNSGLQLLKQPSFESWLPSSQVSPLNKSTTLFPQRSVEVQSAEHPSPAMVLPSSHCSLDGKSCDGRSTKLLPQTAATHTAPSANASPRRPAPQGSP